MVSGLRARGNARGGGALPARAAARRGVYAPLKLARANVAVRCVTWRGLGLHADRRRLPCLARVNMAATASWDRDVWPFLPKQFSSIYLSLLPTYFVQDHLPLCLEDWWRGVRVCAAILLSNSFYLSTYSPYLLCCWHAVASMDSLSVWTTYHRRFVRRGWTSHHGDVRSWWHVWGGFCAWFSFVRCAFLLS